MRIAGVSYLNARPLIHGLDADPEVELSLDVPSRLMDLLRGGQCDVALLPVIDYQRLDGLVLVPAGGIGCDGHTLTVRLFSRVPAEQIDTVACDPDSHTSVVLARVILAERYNLRPEFVKLSQASGRAGEARLLIGDKVICDEPRGFEQQLDLGFAWKQLTGLPFVFAVWMARQETDLRNLPQKLEQAKQRGLASVPDVVERFAAPRGWPRGIAMQYLSVYLKYDVGERELHAIQRFFELAAKHGLIAGAPRELRIYGC